ncbi:MAG: DMT family protein [Hyphomicrobium sp.]
MGSFLLPAPIVPILLLTLSNIFMTFAWYGHLKFKSLPLSTAILIGWGIAFVEYCFAVPANRLGHGVYSAPELKTLQEVITLTVFGIFSICYLKEALTLNHLFGYVLIFAGAFVVFKGPFSIQIFPLS